MEDSASKLTEKLKETATMLFSLSLHQVKDGQQSKSHSWFQQEKILQLEIISSQSINGFKDHQVMYMILFYQLEKVWQMLTTALPHLFQDFQQQALNSKSV